MARQVKVTKKAKVKDWKPQDMVRSAESGRVGLIERVGQRNIRRPDEPRWLHVHFFDEPDIIASLPEQMAEHIENPPLILSKENEDDNIRYTVIVTKPEGRQTTTRVTLVSAPMRERAGVKNRRMLADFQLAKENPTMDELKEFLIYRNERLGHHDRELGTGNLIDSVLPMFQRDTNIE